MATPTRAAIPGVDGAGAVIHEMARDYAVTVFDPSSRRFLLRDGALGIQNNPNYAGSSGRAKFLSYAVPRDGLRVSLNAGVKTFNTSSLPGFS